MGTGLQGIILRSWRGEEKAWKVFWLYYVLFSVFITIAYMPMLIMEVKGITMNVAVQVAYSLTLLIVMVVWLVWIVVSLWRCAFNSEWRGWGYSIRGLLIWKLVMVITEVISLV